MKLIIPVLFSITFYSCIIPIGPQLNYIGDEYDPVTHTDIFYDEKDIDQDYLTIGKLVKYASPSEFQEVKKEMHEKAMKIGAHGMIININRESGVDTSGNVQVSHILESKLIRYKE